jgi:hypothetical protein
MLTLFAAAAAAGCRAAIAAPPYRRDQRSRGKKSFKFFCWIQFAR